MLERMGKRDITRFLRHLWVSKYGDLKDQDLFSALRKHIDEKRIKSLDFARTCSDDCESYVQLLDGKTEHLGKAAPYVQRMIRVLDFQPALPLLLSSYQTLTIPDFETVSKWMLVFITRYAIVSDLDPSGLETIFFELARQIRDTKRNAKDIRGCLANVKDALMKKAPADEQVKVAVANLILLPDEANYVLSRLANRMQTGTREIALDETNLEHIFPKKPKKNEWGGEANHATLEPYLWHIGNLTMLGERLNTGAGNEEYKIKRERYGKRSELKMAHDLLSII
jgi:hypothetical protein